LPTKSEKLVFKCSIIPDELASRDYFCIIRAGS